jgi:hypothetical protein
MNELGTVSSGKESTRKYQNYPHLNESHTLPLKNARTTFLNLGRDGCLA